MLLYEGGDDVFWMRVEERCGTEMSEDNYKNIVRPESSTGKA